MTLRGIKDAVIKNRTKNDAVFGSGYCEIISFSMSHFRCAMEFFLGLKCYPILGQRELEFSGVRAHVGEAADEPFMSEIGTLLPIALCGRNSL